MKTLEAYFDNGDIREFDTTMLTFPEGFTGEVSDIICGSAEERGLRVIRHYTDTSSGGEELKPLSEKPIVWVPPQLVPHVVLVMRDGQPLLVRDGEVLKNCQLPTIMEFSSSSSNAQEDCESA